MLFNWIVPTKFHACKLFFKIEELQAQFGTTFLNDSGHLKAVSANRFGRQTVQIERVQIISIEIPTRHFLKVLIYSTLLQFDEESGNIKEEKC